MRSVRLCIVYFIFFAGFAQAITEDSHLLCGDRNWVAYKDEKCFKYIDEFKIRDEAEKICNQQLLSTDQSIPTLVSIKSEEEQVYLNNFLFVQMQIKETIWMAAKRPDGNSNFFWNDNSLIDYINWAEGSPIYEADRNCVEMRSPNAIKYKRSIYEPSENVTDGKWFNVRCDKRNLILCQKLQNWSFSQLQNTFLDERRELQDTLVDVRKQLYNHESTIYSLQSTIYSLQSTIYSLQPTIYNLQQNPVPIGFIYIQLPSQPDPKTLWWTVEWEDVTSYYAGLFFRAEGGGSAAFEQIQNENSPRLTTIYATKMSETTSDHYGCVNSGVLSIDVGETSHYRGVCVSQYYSTSSDDLFRLAFEVSGGEVRPRNQAMRIWKRAK